MKVIVAGMPKTGTKSMYTALTKLGYNVYDAIENIYFLSDDYIKITFEGWTTEDFRRMYENVDAVVDFPAFFFWDEIHRAFPDAKIILTIRDDEEQWFRSVEKQTAANAGALIIQVMTILSPTVRRGMVFFDRLLMTAMGNEVGNFRKTKLNASLMKKMYRSHNAYVQHMAPKDKLLVFKCKDGWEPLCEFLDVPVPNEPFPHKNVGGNIINEMDENPLFVKLKKEVLVSSALIVSTTAVLTAILYQYGASGIYGAASQFLTSVFSYLSLT